MNRINGLTVAELVAGIEGVIVLGDATARCRDALPLRDATTGCVTMIDDIARGEELNRTGAVAVVTPRRQPKIHCTQIVCADIHAAFSAIVKQFRPVSTGIQCSSIDASAQIDPTASIGVGTRVDAGVVIGANVTIGQNCHLMPGVVVMEHSQIGNDCTLYPRVVLYEQCTLENNVNVHAGSVLGAHGFGYKQNQGQHVLSAQLGFVHIESNVDIGANVTIDRGTYGATRIGEGTKIDNLVQIAHNCHVGRHNLICSQVGMAGSCRTGDYVILAGQVGIADHINIEDQAIVGGQAGVMENLPGHQKYVGSPATVHRDQMQMLVIQRRLPEMRREIRSLRKELNQVVENLSGHSVSEPEAVASDDGELDRPACLPFKRPAA